jgi:hypothetical protein
MFFCGCFSSQTPHQSTRCSQLPLPTHPRAYTHIRTLSQRGAQQKGSPRPRARSAPEPSPGQPWTSHRTHLGTKRGIRGEHTSHTHTQAHVHSVPSGPRQSPALRSYLRGGPRAGLTPPRRSRAALRRGPHGLQCCASGRLPSPPVRSRAAPALRLGGTAQLGRLQRLQPRVGTCPASPARRPPACSRSEERRGAVGAQTPLGQPAASTRSHGARARSGPGRGLGPPGGPSLSLCVSARAATSRNRRLWAARVGDPAAEIGAGLLHCRPPGARRLAGRTAATARSPETEGAGPGSGAGSAPGVGVRRCPRLQPETEGVGDSQSPGKATSVWSGRCCGAGAGRMSEPGL